MESQRGGFTLVELMIVGIVAFALIGGMSFVVTQSGSRVWAHTDAQFASASETQRAIGRITQDLAGTSRATLVCTANVLKFTPAGAAQVTYQRDTSNPPRLVRAVGGVNQVVAFGVTEFTPSCDTTTGLVRLQVSASVQMPGQPARPNSALTQVLVRNP